MPVVRCPTHGVPYNDANPRGCPACWQEKIGDDPANLMKELARASKGIPRVEILPPPTEEEVPTQRLSGAWPPVTSPPRVPTPTPTQLDKLIAFARAHATMLVALAAGAVGLALLWAISRPTFTAASVPPPMEGEALPFPIRPNTPIVGAFAIFGPKQANVHPQAEILARYDFEQGTLVDVYNNLVYAISLVTPERSWEGLRVGLDETRVQGRLALLGPTIEREPPAIAPMPFGGYLTYRNLGALPRRRLTAEVRPPNGCYDVQVEIAPQVIGLASSGTDTLVAVARRGGAPQWVVHTVRVVSRAIAGPYAGAVACE
jgi:hypothetical protein